MTIYRRFDFQSEKNPQTHEKTVVFQDFRTTEHRTDEMRVPDTPASSLARRIVPDVATACRQPDGRATCSFPALVVRKFTVFG